MAYKTEDLFKTAMEQIKKNKLFFIEDIIAFLPCAKPTFYEHFPNESDNYKAMFEELERNRTELKVSMRSKWYKSENATLQITLMKLICTDDERKKMSMNYTENDVKFNKDSPLIIENDFVIDWKSPIDLDEKS